MRTKITAIRPMVAIAMSSCLLFEGAGKGTRANLQPVSRIAALVQENALAVSPATSWPVHSAGGYQYRQEAAQPPENDQELNSRNAIDEPIMEAPSLTRILNTPSSESSRLRAPFKIQGQRRNQVISLIMARPRFLIVLEVRLAIAQDMIRIDRQLGGDTRPSERLKALEHLLNGPLENVDYQMALRETRSRLYTLHLKQILGRRGIPRRISREEATTRLDALLAAINNIQESQYYFHMVERVEDIYSYAWSAWYYSVFRFLRLFPAVAGYCVIGQWQQAHVKAGEIRDYIRRFNINRYKPQTLASAPTSGDPIEEARMRTESFTEADSAGRIRVADYMADQARRLWIGEIVADNFLRFLYLSNHRSGIRWLTILHVGEGDTLISRLFFHLFVWVSRREVVRFHQATEEKKQRILIRMAKKVAVYQALGGRFHNVDTLLEELLFVATLHESYFLAAQIPEEILDLASRIPGLMERQQQSSWLDDANQYKVVERWAEVLDAVEEPLKSAIEHRDEVIQFKARYALAQAVRTQQPLSPDQLVAIRQKHGPLVARFVQDVDVPLPVKQTWAYFLQSRTQKVDLEQASDLLRILANPHYSDQVIASIFRFINTPNLFDAILHRLVTQEPGAESSAVTELMTADALVQGRLFRDPAHFERFGTAVRDPHSRKIVLEVDGLAVGLDGTYKILEDKDSSLPLESWNQQGQVRIVNEIVEARKRQIDAKLNQIVRELGDVRGVSEVIFATRMNGWSQNDQQLAMTELETYVHQLNAKRLSEGLALQARVVFFATELPLFSNSGKEIEVGVLFPRTIQKHDVRAALDASQIAEAKVLDDRIQQTAQYLEDRENLEIRTFSNVISKELLAPPRAARLLAGLLYQRVSFEVPYDELLASTSKLPKALMSLAEQALRIPLEDVIASAGGSKADLLQVLNQVLVEHHIPETIAMTEIGRRLSISALPALDKRLPARQSPQDRPVSDDAPIDLRKAV